MALTHFDSEGDAHMVDVSDKAVTDRIAQAAAWIRMQPETFDIITEGRAKKGDVLAVARLAGIMAAKRTPDLIPLCHPMPLTRVTVDFEILADQQAVRCEVRTETVARTGVEIEALTAVQIGLLTIYDMCKAIDRGMRIGDIGLLHKAGGQSGTWSREEGSI